MSLLTRATAPPASDGVATAARAVLSTLNAGAPALLPDAGAGSTVRRLIGPTGIGTSSLRYPKDPPRRHDDGKPTLYCPPAFRDDRALGETVNEALIQWADEIGVYEGQLDVLRAADFGRLLMLSHPDTDDPDRLLAAAKCAVAEWAVDDYYCDGEFAVTAEEIGPKLALAAAAVDPTHLPADYAPLLEEAMRADPVLRSLRSALEHMAVYSTPAQMVRLRQTIAGWFVALNGEAGWRMARRMPPAWEYLAHREPHSFMPLMAVTDVIGGYELTAAEYADPRVRQAFGRACIASQLVNDLYSMAREDDSEGMEFNLPVVLAAEEGWTREKAIVRTAEIHDELMRAFEAEATPLFVVGSPQLKRFLAGVWAWLGGNRQWHADSERYNTTK